MHLNFRYDNKKVCLADLWKCLTPLGTGLFIQPWDFLPKPAHLLCLSKASLHTSPAPNLPDLQNPLFISHSRPENANDQNFHNASLILFLKICSFEKAVGKEIVKPCHCPPLPGQHSSWNTDTAWVAPVHLLIHLPPRHSLHLLTATLLGPVCLDWLPSISLPSTGHWESQPEHETRVSPWSHYHSFQEQGHPTVICFKGFCQNKENEITFLVGSIRSASDKQKTPLASKWMLSTHSCLPGWT